jgi:hypothetical protein
MKNQKSLEIHLNEKSHIETPYSIQNINKINPKHAIDCQPPHVLLPTSFILSSAPIAAKMLRVPSKHSHAMFS